MLHHKISNINESNRSGLCEVCGPVHIARHGSSYNGKVRWQCSVYIREHRRKHETTYARFKKDKCSKCGFVPSHPCQLDVDHIDENHNNNDASNLQTLCANCHRLKSWMAQTHKLGLEKHVTV